MSYRPSVIAALLALLATPVSAGNVIDPYTLFPSTATTIAYESRGTALELSGAATATPEEVALPSGIEAGDLLIAIVMSGPTGGATTATTGWTRADGSVCDGTWSICLTAFSNPVSSPGSVVAPVFDVMDGRGVTATILRTSNGTSLDAMACSRLAQNATAPFVFPDVSPTAESGIIISAAGMKSITYISYSSLPDNTVYSLVGGTSILSLNVSYLASSGTSPQGSAVSISASAPEYVWLCSIAVH